MTPPVQLTGVVAFSPSSAVAAGGYFGQEYVWDGDFWNVGGAYVQFGPAHAWAPNADEGWLASPSGIIVGCEDVDAEPCTFFSNSGGPPWSWIWGTSDQDIWVVGGGTVWHFEGNVWQPQAPPTIANDDFVGVGGSGDHVWLAGAGGRVLHFQHSTGLWDASIVSNVDFTSVWGNSADDVWLVGGPSVFHWNGSMWEQDTRITGVGFQAVWGPGPGSVWVLDQDVLYHLGP